MKLVSYIINIINMIFCTHYLKCCTKDITINTIFIVPDDCMISGLKGRNCQFIDTAKKLNEQKKVAEINESISNSVKFIVSKNDTRDTNELYLELKLRKNLKDYIVVLGKENEEFVISYYMQNLHGFRTLYIVINCKNDSKDTYCKNYKNLFAMLSRKESIYRDAMRNAYTMTRGDYDFCSKNVKEKHNIVRLLFPAHKICFDDIKSMNRSNAYRRSIETYADLVNGMCDDKDSKISGKHINVKKMIAI